MEKELFDFDVPQYIADELDEYVEEVSKGKCKYMKFENIKALIGLAVLNNRITREQGNRIIAKYS